MTNHHSNPADDLHEIVDQKLTALIRELEEADWSAGEVALVINSILQGRWLVPAQRLQEAQQALARNSVSDGNEG